MKFKNPVYVKALLLFLAGLAAGIAVLILDLKNRELEQGYYLARPEFGAGETQEDLRVMTPYGEQPIQVTVPEQALNKEAIREKLERFAEELDSIILGENESLDEIRFPLLLPQEAENLPIQLNWSVEADSPILEDGTLDQEKIQSEGTLTTLSAKLQWGEELLVTEFTARVYPAPVSEKERFLQVLQAEILHKEKSSQYNAWKELPRTVAGEKLSWRRPMETRGFLILFLSIICSALVVESSRSRERDHLKRARLQMEMDYPEFLSRLKLYMDAGLTSRSAWLKIADDYQKGQEAGKREKRLLYEEIVKSGFEMKSGVSEQRAYERFGERCPVSCYKKLMGLLIQNARKGNRGLSELLEAEMWQAFEERKALAKRQGEEAGTKLLLPMMGMLVVVMVIVIAPALMSMQM